MAGKGRPGRAPKIDAEKLRLIEQGLCWGWTIACCCSYAGIGQSAFFEFQRRNPDIRSRFDLLRQNKEMRARRNVAVALEEGDLQTSRWFLERRVPEFSPRACLDVAVEQQVDEATVAEALQKLIATTQRRAELLA